MLPCYSAYHGPCSQIESMKEELLSWTFERRETRLVVLTLSVITKACLLPLMEQKLALAHYMVTRRFLKKPSIVYRMGTKVSQRPPGKVCQEVLEFQDFICPMLRGPERELRLIINMDQTSVLFLMHKKKRLRFLARKPLLSGPQRTTQGVLPLRLPSRQQATSLLE